MSGMPHDIKAALAAVAPESNGADLKRLSAEISGHYRNGGASASVIADAAGAHAYAVSRMPATYAAVRAVLGELAERAPDFSARTLIDAGCGPGTASFAAAEFSGDISSARLVDHNPAFLALAAGLAGELGRSGFVTEQAELPQWRPDAEADLTICAYALTEMREEVARGVVERLWQATAGVLVLVEPGRPEDFRRLLGFRDTLLAQGAELLAPCPNGLACPLPADDWCHFSVRLDRSRQHRAAKGAALGYEDEKFSYLVAARPGIGRPAQARVLRRPVEGKAQIELSLCREGRAERLRVQKRDKAPYAKVRRLDWGDAFEPIAEAEGSE